MRLKIGELAKRSGLTVRALHHYDAIGLLSPSQRSEGGARLYGPDDWIRLHRIEALKAFGHSLADIQACLDDPAVGMPLQILRRQIARLEAEAVRAQRLSRHLRQVVDLVTAGDETPAADWLNALELMNMYKKHLNENEVDALLAAGPDNVLHAETSWTTLTREVRDAVAGALPTDSSAAQALAWRWVRAVIGITRNDPVLASKLMQLQLGEPRTQQITGVTAAMLAWIDDAFVHARCALFAKYLDPEQVDEVRRRQFTPENRRAWPALVTELRRLLDAEVAPGAAPVQALVKRWQQLFRESCFGDDAVLESRVREAIMREADLQLGIGLDEALLTYLHQATVAGHETMSADPGPKPSAWLVATQRAAHQLLDRPLVLDDPTALTILGTAEAQALRDDIDRFRHPASVGLRSAVVVRSRLADDVWNEAIEQGIRQHVILGAGLDTSAFRHPNAPGRIFEVDLPDTQRWKQARLREAGVTAPPSLSFVPADFEDTGLAEGLSRAGFDAAEPALFTWLGVTMYLDPAAVTHTLRFIVKCAKGSAVLLEHAVPLDSLPPVMRVAMTQMTAQFAARGEPWKSFFEPEDLAKMLEAEGFNDSQTWTPEALNQRYLAQRTDGLHLGATPTRLVLARV